jgi:hypothetical protein
MREIILRKIMEMRVNELYEQGIINEDQAVHLIDNGRIDEAGIPFFTHFTRGLKGQQSAGGTSLRRNLIHKMGLGARGLAQGLMPGTFQQGAADRKRMGPGAKGGSYSQRGGHAIGSMVRGAAGGIARGARSIARGLGNRLSQFGGGSQGGGGGAPTPMPVPTGGGAQKRPKNCPPCP